MICKRTFLLLVCITLLLSCTVTRNYNPNKKFSPEELQVDFNTMQNILVEKHPSLYWYTPEDSMNFFFNASAYKIRDSMTELQFAWRVVAPLLTSIHCGHTSFIMSKEWQHFIRDKRIPSFPLFLKVWKDSMMVVASMIKNSPVPPGSFITAINGIPVRQLIDIMFQFMPADGYSDNLNYIKLSADFPFYHRNIFGLNPFYNIDFTDSNGVARQRMVPWWYPVSDSTRPIKKVKRQKMSAAEKRLRYRSVKIDSNTAVMDVNSFTKGKLKSFYKQSFKEIKSKKIQNLIIDLRINGGGDINKAVSLARYISDNPFRVADSAWAKSKNLSPYSGRISNSFWNNLALLFFTKKKQQGKYHFGFWERHVFKPKKRLHFDGQTYILINGLTFSAASLFCNIVRDQPNITLVGEETGGGWYGNSGILIPNITLPNTHLRIRLPLFRLVSYDHPSVKGSGVMPEWYIGPDWRDILKGKDTKLDAVLKKINENHFIQPH